MFCPKCGRENLEGKKFCPSCGLKLQAFIEAMTHEQTSQQEVDNSPEISSLPPKRWRGAPAYGLFVVILGVLIALLGNMLANPVVANIGVMIMVLGMGSIGFFEMLRRGRRSAASPSAKTLPPKVQTAKLPTTIEPSSITEHTTRKLELKLERDEKRTPSKELFQS